MFVFVIDTSFMNVSISAVVDDLDTTVSGVQAAVTIEALVSAAFILISSKLGDLFGRKRAYVVGLLFYMVGALAMVFAQGLTAIIVFWAVIGGLGASLYLPAMQSLIHGNFEGKARARVYALVGAAGAIAAAIGPLIGGFVTTLVSWRAGFVVEALIIATVLFGSRLIRDVPYTGDRSIDGVGALLSVLGMGGLIVGVLVWQEGGESVAALLALGVAAMAGLAYWLVRRKRAGKPTLLDPTLFTLQAVQRRGLPDLPPASSSGRDADRASDLPPARLGLQRAPSRCDACTTVAHDVRSCDPRREESGQATTERHRPGRVRAARGIDRDPDSARPKGRLRLAPRDPVDARGGGARPAGVSAQQLRAVAHLGGEGRRGRRRHLGDRIVRPLVRSCVRGRDHARHAVDCLHPHGGSEQRSASSRPAARRGGAGRRRTGDERYAAGRATGRPAGSDPRRDHRASTPTHGTSAFRSRCWSRSSPRSWA